MGENQFAVVDWNSQKGLSFCGFVEKGDAINHSSHLQHMYFDDSSNPFFTGYVHCKK
jgi:hypothetical protein